MSTETFRTEHDSFGPIQVPSDKYWAAQTQRSIQNFDIARATDRMPLMLIKSLAVVKKSIAAINIEHFGLNKDIGNAIMSAADEVIQGKLNDHFPLVVWQTGSGTQSNMNMNEVLSNRGSEIMGGPVGEGRLIHANDHCNKSQSSNDTFPTAMHVATIVEVHNKLKPAL